LPVDPTADRSLMLSVVIPTFRRPAYLPCLFAALAQEVEGLQAEVLLVDNDPEGSARSFALPRFARYVHEPDPGVANARNRGVAEARGSHVVFLDDDEVPVQGWLRAFAASAESGAKAAFGPVEADFDAPPPPVLRAPLERVFSRVIDSADGGDISAKRAYLGSGNSLFARDLLLRITPPFDPAFNGGGEDVWLLRQLVDEHGARLVWCAGARVRERVPATRSTRSFLRRRRYRDGQLRCIVETGIGGWRAPLRVGFWMVAGGAQVVIGTAAALLSRPFSAGASLRWELMAFGGAGKLLWWR